MARHNIYLSGNQLSDNVIIIKGNRLNLRWFDKCILVWSDEDSVFPIPKKLLEIIEEALKINPSEKTCQ
jgi:hypothetical protein